MGKMYLMCGLSGAGKTTFAKKFAADNNAIYLSIDDFYKDWVEETCPWMDSPWDDSDASFCVWIRFFETINQIGRRRPDKDVIIDTNALTPVKRLQFIDWFPFFSSYNLILLLADKELRYKNNESKDRVVPLEEMERMEREFELPGFVSLVNSEVFVSTESRWDSIKVFRNKDNKLKELKVEFDELI